MPVDFDRAGRGFHQTDDRAQQRALADPVAPHYGDRLGSANGQAQAVDDRHAIVAGIEAGDPEHAFRRRMGAALRLRHAAN